MYLILNNNNEIKGVGVTTNPNYTSVYVDENADMFPFKDKSVAYMCCYKVNVIDGMIVSLTPYIDSRLIEHFADLGTDTETNASDIADNRDGLIETFDTTLVNSNELVECREAIIELYGMIGE